MGFTGDERTTRRAVAAVKACLCGLVIGVGIGRGSPSPGLWLQFDWGAGPIVFGPDGRPRPTLLFCAWLAWSRFRVVIPTWDRKLGTLVTCLDTTLRRVGGAPTYALTDNEKTVTVEHVAGIPVRHPMIVAAGRHYGLTVHTCVPFDPESKGGSEATVRIAKADLVPTKANLRTGYNSFAELAEACEAFCEKVNGRVHRETDQIPAEALLRRAGPAASDARTRRSPPRSGRPAASTIDQTIRFGSVRYSTPPGLVGREVWVRADGEELVITAAPRRWARARSPGTGSPRRATRGSTCRTTPTIPNSPTGHRSRRSPRAATAEEKAFLGARAGCALLAGRGRRRRRPAGPVEDDRRRRARRTGRRRAGRRRARCRRGRGTVRRGRPARDRAPPRERRLGRIPGGRRRGPLRAARHQRLGRFGTRTELDTDVETREES